MPEPVTVIVWFQGASHRCELMPAERDRLLKDWKEWGGGSPIRTYDLVTVLDTPVRWMLDISTIAAIQY